MNPAQLTAEQALRKLIAVYQNQIVALHERFSLKRPLENDLYAIDILMGETKPLEERS